MYIFVVFYLQNFMEIIIVVRLTMLANSELKLL